jgi:hypothetical protein
MPIPMPPVPRPYAFTAEAQEGRPLPSTPTQRNTLGPHKTKRDIALTDPNETFTGKYSSDVAKDIISSATKAGVDPITGLAMGLQESTLGNAGHENPLAWKPITTGEHPMAPVTGMKWWEMPTEALRPFFLDASFDRLKQTTHDKQVDPSDEELYLQAYNGMGPVPGNSMYGGQSGLTGRKDRPYGKAVMRLREDILRPNPAIQGLLNMYGKL